MVRSSFSYGSNIVHVRLCYFQALTMITAWALYILRIFAAWWLIRRIKTFVANRRPLWRESYVFYLSVFIGAEITFAIDYFIFRSI
jgi:hypothetical protein